MIPSLRKAFNEGFTPDRYRAFLRAVDDGCGTHVQFRLSETPCFFPKSLLDRMAENGKGLIRQLVEQRLIATDMAHDTGELTIEPAHEALLRQWGLLQEWLKEDATSLGVMEGVRRATREWEENGRNAIWLTHKTGRLELAERLRDRPDLVALFPE